MKEAVMTVLAVLAFFGAWAGLLGLWVLALYIDRRPEAEADEEPTTTEGQR